MNVKMKAIKPRVGNSNLFFLCSATAEAQEIVFRTHYLGYFVLILPQIHRLKHVFLILRVQSTHILESQHMECGQRLNYFFYRKFVTEHSGSDITGQSHGYI